MKQKRLTYQQRCWIEDAYQSIQESPEAFGYDSLEDHFDEIVDVIKEDADQSFQTIIDSSLIKSEIQKFKPL